MLLRTGKQQSDALKDVKPLMDLLDSGPVDFFKAFQLRFVDGAMYHQDLLHSLTEEGIQIWSLRKYWDSLHQNPYYAAYDLSKWLLPQILEKSRNYRNKMKDEKEKAGEVLPQVLKKSEDYVELTESEKQKVAEDSKAKEGLSFVLSLASAGTSIKDIFFHVKVNVPCTIGLVYLEDAIEGYVDLC